MPASSPWVGLAAPRVGAVATVARLQEGPLVLPAISLQVSHHLQHVALGGGRAEEEELEEEGGEVQARGSWGRGSHTIRPDYISVLSFQQRLLNTLHAMVRTSSEQ